MPIQYETEIAVQHASSWRFVTGITFYVKWLMISNTVIFLLFSIGVKSGFLDPLRILNLFGQVNSVVFTKLMIWQFVTAMFIHGGIRHLLGNLFYLWMFGTLLEQEWGRKRFIIYYLVCGVGAGLIQFCIAPSSSVPGIGASGAIFGLLGGCALLFPDRYVYLLMARIRLKYVIAVFTIIELYLCIMGAQDGIGHWVHVSGFVIGIIFIKIKAFLLQKKANKALSGNMPKKGGRFDNIEL